MILTPEQFQQQGGQVQPSQSDASNMFQTFANNVKAGTVSATPDPTQNLLQKFGNVANAVGVSKLGQGLATTGLEATGQENQAGDAEAQYAKQLTQVMQKYPVGSPQRAQAIQNMAKIHQQTQVTQADIDPGTALSDRDVIGSAVSTAGLALGGGELEGATAAEEAEGAEAAKNLSTGEKVLQGAKTGAKVGGIVGASQGLGSGLQNDKENALQVGEDTVKGGVGGAAGGAVIGAAIPAVGAGIKAGQDAIAEASNKAATQGITDSQTIARNAIKNPTDMEQAFKEGRITLENGKNVIQPSKSEQSLISTLKPLAEKGNEAGVLEDAGAKGNKGVEAQLNNRAVVQQELENESNKLRGALKGWDETDRLNAQKTKDFLEKATPIERARFIKSIGGKANLKSELSPSSWNLKDFRENIGPDNVKIPDPVKNEPTMARNAQSLQNAAGDLAKKVGRNSEDLLDLRQNFDDYVQQNYGKGFFEKGRNADPWHQYVYSMRDQINELAADRLPDGKLPDGTSYKESMLKQHNLINARDEMAAKYAREVPENSSTISRWEKQNPTKSMLIRRIGLREGIGIGAGAIGLTALGAEIHKGLSGK